MKLNKNIFLSLVVFPVALNAADISSPPGRLMPHFMQRISEALLPQDKLLVEFLSQALMAGNKNHSAVVDTWVSKTQLDIIKDAKELVAGDDLKRLEHHWIKSNRLTGFSNSLSKHTAAHGVDLQAMLKLLPEGPLLQCTLGHMEMNRHSPDTNALVKMSNWGAVMSTALQVPLYAGLEQVQAGNFSGALAEIAAHRDQVGVFILAKDFTDEIAEAFRELYWFYLLSVYQERYLAYKAGVGWLGDLHTGSRKLRKFINLIPSGHALGITFQNALAVPLFVLDFKDGYLYSIQDRYESLMKRELGSGEYYSEAMSLLLKVVEPALATSHLIVFGFGKKPKAGFGGGYLHQAQNFLQYSTFALPQAWLHCRVLSKVLTQSEIAPLLPFAAIGMLYRGWFGKSAMESVKYAAPTGLKVILAESLLSSVIGAAAGDPHFSLFGKIIKYFKTAKEEEL